MKMPFHVSILAVGLAAGCATDSDVPHFYVGVLRDRLKSSPRYA